MLGSGLGQLLPRTQPVPSTYRGVLGYWLRDCSRGVVGEWFGEWVLVTYCEALLPDRRQLPREHPEPETRPVFTTHGSSV